ncbi:MAG TPA: hypothetical protein VEC38_03085 [Candidatus Binataceae bacterium]|nr:hypothetical protein [Candidatus Binataceae bacterium]
MKTNHAALIAFVSTALLAGCATVHVQMPAPAQIAAPSGAPGGPQVGVAPARDSRSSNDAGALGIKGAPLPLGTDVEVGSDLGAYVTGALAQGLAAQKFAVVTVSDPTQPHPSGQPAFGGKTVVATIQSASLNTADAIMFAADCAVSFAAQVYDPSGTVVYAQTYSGQNSEHLGAHGVGGYEVSAGQVLAKAADRAVASALEDPKFIQALR